MPKNGFESGDRKVIPAVTVYLRREVLGERQLLMIHRNGKKDGTQDFHEGRWNGLGGKLEVGESPWDAARREMQEEAGLTLALERYRALGFLQFPNFKPHKAEDWHVVVFVADLLEGDPAPVLGQVDEGALSWVSEAQVLGLPLWPGDVHFIPFVLRRAPFVGSVFYENLVVVRHQIESI